MMMSHLPHSAAKRKLEEQDMLSSLTKEDTQHMDKKLSECLHEPRLMKALAWWFETEEDKITFNDLRPYSKYEIGTLRNVGEKSLQNLHKVLQENSSWLADEAYLHDKTGNAILSPQEEYILNVNKVLSSSRKRAYTRMVPENISDISGLISKIESQGYTVQAQTTLKITKSEPK
jgi:hypothetical protein